MRLYLLRHGKTRANVERLYCGSTDLPLCPEGREELLVLAGKSWLPKPEAFYTSGMVRTEQTLEALYPGAKATAVPSLREMDFGDFEMRSYEMLKENPTYWAWISGDNEKNICPNGESGEMCLRRAEKAVREILETGKDSLVVTHGGVIAGLMAEWFPQEGKNRYTWQPKPGHGYEITLEQGKPQGYSPFPTND